MLSTSRFLDQSTNQPLYVPFCKDVRDFVTQSCAIQTHYENLEGVHSRRCLNYSEIEKDKDYLKEFIECTVYPEESFHLNLDKKKNYHVKILTEKVISIGLQFSTTEIHFSSVWVCYFDYADNNLKSIPFIKVFTSTNLDNDKSVYIDVNATSFEEWDHLLDFASIPPSFVCVPRHGKYSKINGKLDLEYFSTSRIVTAYSSGYQGPFSCTIIGPRLETINYFCNNILKTILEWRSFLIATVVGYLKQAQSNWTKAVNQLKKIFNMFHDKCLKDVDFKSLLGGNYKPENLDDTFKLIMDLGLLFGYILSPTLSLIVTLINLFTKSDSQNFCPNLMSVLMDLKLLSQKCIEFRDKKEEKQTFSNLTSMKIRPDGVCDNTSDIFSVLKKIDALPLENKLTITEIKNEDITTLVNPKSGFDPIFHFKKTSFNGVYNIIKNIVKVNFSLTPKNDGCDNKWEITDEKLKVIGYLLLVENSIIGCFSKNLFDTNYAK